MLQYAVKVIVSALVIVAVSELAKRHSLIGALLASLPLTSLLAFVWLYLDTGDSARIALLSGQIFWLVIPSLALFLLLPLFIRLGLGFWAGLLLASGGTVLCYLGMLRVLRHFGVQL